ncbi:MAG: carboxylating.nicotinate-nucleotide diphosphorylase, partial [Candidatus Bathyarchaeota archaeon]
MRGGLRSHGGALTEEKVRDFLEEDVGYGDITSMALIEGGQRARARLFFQEDGVTAGLGEAAAVFDHLGCEAVLHEDEGCWVPSGKILMEIDGPARALLAGERTVLNLVGRMAGIATNVAEAVSKAAGIRLGIRVAATRKTAPGLRDLDKRAVELGGGDTHRIRQDDCVLLK